MLADGSPKPYYHNWIGHRIGEESVPDLCSPTVGLLTGSTGSHNLLTKKIVKLVVT